MCGKHFCVLHVQTFGSLINVGEQTNVLNELKVARGNQGKFCAIKYWNQVKQIGSVQTCNLNTKQKVQKKGTRKPYGQGEMNKHSGPKRFTFLNKQIRCATQVFEKETRQTVCSAMATPCWRRMRIPLALAVFGCLVDGFVPLGARFRAIPKTA